PNRSPPVRRGRDGEEAPGSPLPAAPRLSRYAEVSPSTRFRAPDPIPAPNAPAKPSPARAPRPSRAVRYAPLLRTTLRQAPRVALAAVPRAAARHRSAAPARAEIARAA